MSFIASTISVLFKCEEVMLFSFVCLGRNERAFFMGQDNHSASYPPKPLSIEDELEHPDTRKSP